MSPADSDQDRRPVLGFPAYAVARDHTVWSCQRGEWRALTSHPRRGGPSVGLRRNGKTFERTVARLVREAFGPGALVPGKHPSGRSLGSRHGRAVLQEYQVQEARALKARGWTYSDLVRLFQVSKSTLYHAITGRTWRHVRDVKPT